VNIKNAQVTLLVMWYFLDLLGACPRIEAVARNSWFESVFSLIYAYHPWYLPTSMWANVKILSRSIFEANIGIFNKN